jgi:hypothetical protein
LRFGAIILWATTVVDSVLVSTQATFVSRTPTHVLRSVILSLLTFLQIVAAYGVLYAIMARDFVDSVKSHVAWIYFSLVTAATVGYGDIQPKSDALWLQLAVMSEIITALYILIVLFAIVVTWVNVPPEPPLPLAALNPRLESDD